MTQVNDGKGKLLTIGHLYEFSDTGTDWGTYRLHSVDLLKPSPYRLGQRGNIGYKLVREVQCPVGKIEYVPIELLDGEVYSFFVKQWGIQDRAVGFYNIGFYNKSKDAFYVHTSPKASHIQDANMVTDIVLLKPVTQLSL